MKYSIVAFFLISVISCSNPSQDSKLVNKKDENAKESSDFKVLKSGVFWDELDEGKFDIVKFKDGTIDSVDTYFGIYTLKNNSVVYLKISKNDSNEVSFKGDSIYGSIDQYILKEKVVKTPVSEFAEYFDDYFSSPNLIDDKLYYWGLERVDSIGIYNIYACEVNLISKGSTKFFLLKDEVATDYRGYFQEPIIKNNIIIYKLENGNKWAFSKDFKIKK